MSWEDPSYAGGPARLRRAAGSSGRRPLRVYAKCTRLQNRYDGAPGSVRPTGGDVRNHDDGRGFVQRRGAAPPVNSARLRRAAGSSRTPTPTGLREMYAGAKTVGSAKPSRRAGVEPRPYMKSKRRRRFTASRETAEEMTTHSHRRRQSIFLIDAALRAAASLFSIVTQDGQRRIFQRSQPTAPKRRIGLPRSVGEAGGTLPVRWVHTPNKSRFSLGRHSRFFGQGPKKWGGI